MSEPNGEVLPRLLQGVDLAAQGDMNHRCQLVRFSRNSYIFFINWLATGIQDNPYGYLRFETGKKLHVFSLTS